MDNKDQRTLTHTQGHEAHGVHACHKCGWHFPNQHPSSKQRRAHKKVCGTIQVYKPIVSELQTNSNALDDDEHLYDDDPHMQGPSSSDTGINRKVNGGTGDHLTTSGDEVFLDAIANFSDGAPSPGTKETLPDTLNSGTVEIVNIKYQEFSGSSDFNDDGQMQDPNILQREMIKDGNTQKLPGQLSGSHVDPLSSSITDLRTVVLSDDFFSLSCGSNPSKGEAAPDMLPENKIYAAENVRHYSLASVEKVTNLKENDEIKSDSDMIDIMFFSDNTVGEASEAMLKIAVSDVVNSNCLVAGGAFDLEEKKNVKLLSVILQEKPTLEVNSVLSVNTFTNGVQVDTANMTQCATSGDVKVLQEIGEGNVSVFTSSLSDNRADVVHLQNECADFKDHKEMLPRNSLIVPSSEAWKRKQEDLNDSDDEENYFLISQSQLREKRDVLPSDGSVLDSIIEEQGSREPLAEKMHADETIEVSSVKFMTETSTRSDETGASVNALKPEMNENYMIHFSEEKGSDSVSKNSQQISLPECSSMAVSKENSSDTSFGGSTAETTSVISMKEIAFTNVDSKCGGANAENDIEISKKTLQFSDMHLEVKPSSGVYKTDDVVEMCKFEKCDITDAQYTERSIVKDTLPKPADSNFECPILSEVVMDRFARTPKGIECANRGPQSGVQEDIRDNEINSSCRINKDCNGIISTSADSYQTQNVELLVKPEEVLVRNYSSFHSLNVEPSFQCVSVVEDTHGEKGREVPGITCVPVQDQSDNKKVQLPSSAIYTSIDYGIQRDSLEGNWGSVSAQGVIDVEALPSSDSVRSTEAGKSNLKDHKAASKTQQFETPEMFEAPSFMTLVEPGHAVAASKVHNGLNQHPSSTSSEAGWFPTLTQVTYESQGRKRNEEIIAKISNYRTIKQRTPPQSPLTEASHSNKPESPKLEENSVINKNGESPAAKGVKGEGGKAWNSPASNPADNKRKNKKVKSKQNWIPFVCCSSVNSPQR